MPRTDRPSRFARALFVLLLALATVLPGPVASRAAENKVLELDGRGSFVEFSPTVFSNLTSATVEGWVKWDSFRLWSRFFDFGSRWNGMAVSLFERGPDFYFHLFAPAEIQKLVVAKGLLETNRWFHIAAVTGPGGMKLYMDGLLLGKNPITNSFSTIQTRRESYLGRSAWLSEGVTANERQDEDFHGQMDEVRVWSTERTEAEIRANMHQRLAGSEPGLVSLWNFENIESGVVKDSGPGKNDGRLRGNAKAASGTPPVPERGPAERVLDLDGGGYVQLPDDIFTNLTEATVEAHVFWRRASGGTADSQRFFSFGTLYNDIGAGQEGPGRMIYFISRNQQANATLRTAPILQVGRWNHVAAVSGPQGMKLYLNGSLVASSPSTWSFPVTSGKRNMIGAYNSWPDGGIHRVKLDAMVDEFRVWSRARTDAEIREWMNKKARGDEPDLAGLWNFDDGSVRDASPRGNHGVIVGSGKVSESDIVIAGATLNLLSGKILGPNGQPAAGAQVSMELNGVPLVTAVAGADGGYQLVTRATNGLAELTAISGEGIARHSLSLSAGEHQIPTLTLEQNSISGTVASLDFSPLQGAIVESLWFGEGASAVVESPATGASAPFRPGLVGEFFRLPGSPAAIPEMKGRPHATRIDAMLDYQNLTRFAAIGVNENFAARWTGKLRVAKAGTYRFYIRVDDGGRVYIDGKLVADNKNVWNEEGMGETALAAGDHDLRVEMIQQEGGASCVLLWSSGDFTKQPVPAAALWHEASPELDTVTLAPLNPEAKALLTNSALTDASGNFKLTGLRRGWHQLRVHDGQRYRHFQDESSKALRLDANAQLSLSGASFRISPPKEGFWRNHTHAGGLADNRVHCVLADSKGLVWFGTGDGVSRFDGEKFVNLSKEDGLANNTVFAAYEDKSGAIWFGTHRGVSCYRNGEFVEIAELSAMSAEPVRGITEDASGAMWFSTVPNGLFKHEGKKVEHFSVTNGLPQGVIYQITRGPDGHLWAACNGNVFRHTGSNFVDVFPGGYLGAAVGDIDLGRNGSVWLATTEGLMQYDGTNLVLLGRSRGLANLAVSIIGAMNVDPDGTVWFGTSLQGSSSGDGLTRFDGEAFSYFPSINGLPQSEVTGVARDQRGLLWVSTWDNGVWSCEKRGFVSYSGREGLIATNLEVSLGSRDGAVWFGGEGAFGRIENGRVENFNYIPGSMGLFHNALASTADGSIWVGSRGPFGGVVKFDGTNFNVPRIEGWPTGLGLRGLAVTPDGNLWIANMSEVSSYDGSRLARKRASDFQLTNQNAFAAIHAAGDGSVWLGTSGEGLVRIRGQGFSRLTTRDGLADDDVTAIASDPDGTLWIGTVNGVSRYDGKSFANFSQAKGRLAGNSILCVFRDSRGAHWFGTRRGATRLADEAWSTFDTRDGIAGNEVRSICEGTEGAIWFATEKGLSRYTPRVEKPRALALTVAGDAQPGTEPGQYRLLKGRRLAFEIGAMDPLTDGRKRWYQRQILPGSLSEDQLKAHRDWGAPSREAQLEWMPERSGNFTVAARYIDRDSNYSDPVLAYITVVPPWYSNPLIAGPLGAAVAGLVGWAFVARTLYMRKRREAERLREKMLEQEHAAREAAERAHAEIETKNAELAAAKVAAEQASHAKSQFLANMSHELRTPLTAIIGFSEMLITEAQAEKRAEQAEDLTRINDSANHLLGLINGILDLSKIEAQKMDLHLESFDVPALVREAAEMIRSLVDRKGNRLEIDCPPEVGTMRADLVKVRQCLLNLMGNANKFTDRGTIRLRVERAGEIIRFAVSDTGIGMTPKQMENLFQPFTQGDASTARKYGGSGLGLTITKRFCEMMGGTIRAESEAGRGSTFTMELPASVGGLAANPSANGAAGHAAVEKNGKYVLVIDDDPNVHRLIEKTLKDEPVSLRFALNAEEGLRLARQIKPAVITLDVMMPQTDGWSVLSSLKADPALAKIPVVMLTIIGDRELGFALGAADYLVKPIDRNQLMLTLKKHLAANGGGRVLIVEDDPALREMLRRMLEGEQWEVEDAANGAIALERLRATAPSIILLDLAMPVMDGFQVLAELHKHEKWREIPVVVITAMDLTQADRQQLLTQTERIFEKGTHLQQDLVREIRSCLEQYRP